MCLKDKEEDRRVLSEDILERLINTYGDAVLRMCYLYLKDYHMAEDAVQETFIKAMRSYDSFQNKSSEKTWLTRIAINCCKNIMRTRWFRLPALDIAKQHLESENQIEVFIEKNNMSNAIMSLNIKDRQLIVLYYYQELSVKEIANVTGKRENTISQQLRRAREKLKKILEEENNDRFKEYQKTN